MLLLFVVVCIVYCGCWLLLFVVSRLALCVVVVGCSLCTVSRCRVVVVVFVRCLLFVVVVVCGSLSGSLVADGCCVC